MRVDISKFLAQTLGEDFFEVLAKTELYKPNANVAIDLEDIRIGLKVVPRLVMSILVRELPPMTIGQAKEVVLPLGGPPVVMNVNKHDTDTYSGSLMEGGKIVAEFKYRPLPGVGLVIMSAFELYGMKELEENTPEHFAPQAEVNVQKLIDERLALHDMVGQVVNHKLSEREVLQKLFLSKLTDELNKTKEELEHERVRLAGCGVAAAGSAQNIKPGDYGHSASLDDVNRLYKEKEKVRSDITNIKGILKDDPHSHKDEYQRGLHNGIAIADAAVNKKDDADFIDAPKKSDVVQEAAKIVADAPKKSSPLKGFLEKKESKKKKPEFEFKMVKSEISCPDCKQQIFNGNLFSSCICYGEDFQRKVFVKKSEEAGKYSISFSKGWDVENIQMLVELLRKKNG